MLKSTIVLKTYRLCLACIIYPHMLHSDVEKGGCRKSCTSKPHVLHADVEKGRCRESCSSKKGRRKASQGGCQECSCKLQTLWQCAAKQRTKRCLANRHATPRCFNVQCNVQPPIWLRHITSTFCKEDPEGLFSNAFWHCATDLCHKIFFISWVVIIDSSIFSSSPDCRKDSFWCFWIKQSHASSGKGLGCDPRLICKL